MASQADLDNWFAYHPPFGDQTERYTKLREKAREFGELICVLTPSCADQTVALRKLRELVMAVNLTIACNEKQEQKQ
jgi:hypothetical protein